MSKHHPSRSKKTGRDGDRSKAAAVWLSILLVVGVAAAGALSLPGRKASAPVPDRTTSGSQPTAAKAALPAAEQDRELRREQLEAAEKLLADFPANDDAVYLAGLIHEDQGNSEQAVKLWERSIELDATRADANESLGQALLLKDDYAGAEKYFRRALALDKDLQSARFRLATALSQQGQLPEARSVLEQAGPLSAEGHRLMGEICQQLQQPTRARTNYEAAIRLKPNFPEACYGLAQTLAQLGETELSREYREKSATLRKQSDEQARLIRANFDSLSVTHASVARTHTDVGRVYMTLGHAKKAEELWLRAAALDPQNVLCRLQLGVLYQQTRRDREALRFYEEVIKLDPKDGLTQLNLGRVCLKLNHLERAELAFQEVIRLEPKRPEGYSALAQLHLQSRRNLPEAERLAGLAAELAPEAPYYALLSQVRAQNGNPGGALAAINRALELQPANPQFAQMRNTILARKP